MAKVSVQHHQEILSDYRSPKPYGDWSRSYGRGTVSAQVAKEGDYLCEPVFFSKGKEKDIETGDFVHVIIATYSEGDSFGRETGKEEVMAVAGNQEALREIMEKIKDAGDSRSHSFEFDSHRISIPWYGYFEQLEDLRVETVIVAPSW